MAFSNPYQILGVPPGASQQEIKDAYRSLAKQYHPDLNDDPGASAKMQAVNDAYAELTGGGKPQGSQQQGWGPGSPFGGFTVFFNGMPFGGGSAIGSHIEIAYQITLKQALAGLETDIQYDRLDTCDGCGGSGSASGAGDVRTCPACRGSGRMGLFVPIPCQSCGGRGQQIGHPCPLCSGRGMQRKTAKARLVIPRGMRELRVLRLQEVGNSLVGGRRGDVFVKIMYREHPFFRTSGADLLCIVPVTVWVATFGGKTRVPTLDGEAELAVPPGTQNGQALLMKGLGLPLDSGSVPRGDLRVQVIVEVPRLRTPGLTGWPDEDQLDYPLVGEYEKKVGEIAGMP